MRNPKDKVVVCGAGGFIGGHLVGDLLRQGPHRHPRRRHQAASTSGIRNSPTSRTSSSICRKKHACDKALKGANIVYNLAADMGGMGFIENNRALCMLSVLINTHLLHGRQGQRRRSGISTPPAPASTTPTSSATRTSPP